MPSESDSLGVTSAESPALVGQQQDGDHQSKASKQAQSFKKVVANETKSTKGSTAARSNQDQSSTNTTAGETADTVADGKKISSKQGTGKKGKTRRGQNKRWRKRPYHFKRQNSSGNSAERTNGESDGGSSANKARQDGTRKAVSLSKFGKPFAPYNTTQFIMDDHNLSEPDFAEINKIIIHNHSHSNNMNSSNASNMNASMTSNGGDVSLDTTVNNGSDSDEFYSSPDDEQDFLEQQFAETYDNIHAERLTTMTKNELVTEYIALEERVDDLERKLKAARDGTSASPLRDLHIDPEAVVEAKRYQHEIERLLAENTRLRVDNDQLRERLNSSTSGDQVDEDTVPTPLLTNGPLTASQADVSMDSVAP